jgi:hypothetical protein
MPYRALLMTIVTVALALLAVAMWVAAVAPMLATAPPTATGPTPEHQLHILTRGVLILSFLLICLLLVVGLVSTMRQWLRSRQPVRKRVRTRYVDAWKIAGERLEPKDEQSPPLQ